MPPTRGWRIICINRRGQTAYQWQRTHRQLSLIRLAERTFCKQCGTQLYFHLLPESGMDEAWYVNAGLFADNADFALTLQMFTDCQAPYYHLADDTVKLTEQQFLEMVGAAE